MNRLLGFRLVNNTWECVYVCAASCCFVVEEVCVVL